MNRTLRRALGFAIFALALVLAGLALARSPSVPLAPLRGQVIGISDGDTLTVLVDQRPVKVRLWGIDAPEKAQAFGAKSKASLAEMAFGKEALVEVRDIDRYGRSVGWVMVAGRPVNLLLVQQGLAWWYQQFARRDTQLRDAEAKARAGRVGLWADENPQPPWEFRKERRNR